MKLTGIMKALTRKPDLSEELESHLRMAMAKFVRQVCASDVKVCASDGTGTFTEFGDGKFTYPRTPWPSMKFTYPCLSELVTSRLDTGF